MDGCDATVTNPPWSGEPRNRVSVRVDVEAFGKDYGVSNDYVIVRVQVENLSDACAGVGVGENSTWRADRRVYRHC